MTEYQEYNLSKDATPDHAPQYTLYGDKEGERGDRIATFYNKHYAELCAEFLNQMVEECGACGQPWHDYKCMEGIT